MRGRIGRPCKVELRGKSGRSKWEAEGVRQSEAKVGGHGKLKWEAMRGRIGRSCEAEMGGRSRRLM